MAEPGEAIKAIQALAGSEIAFDHVLNSPVKGIKKAEKAMEGNRLWVFELIVGRKPTAEEKQQLLFGDS